MNRKYSHLTLAALLAALYVLLTYLAAAFGLSSGAVQLRFSEALNVLCLFSPAAVAGMTAGCFLANLLTGCALWDVALGSLATFLGALLARKLRNRPRIALWMPVLTNALLIPPVLCYVYQAEGTLWFFALTVGLGQIVSCTLLGGALYRPLQRILSKKS